jgi:hypothetical protein
MCLWIETRLKNTPIQTNSQENFAYPIAPLSPAKFDDFQLKSAPFVKITYLVISGRRTKPLRGRNKGWCEAPFFN